MNRALWKLIKDTFFKLQNDGEPTQFFKDGISIKMYKAGKRTHIVIETE